MSESSKRKPYLFYFLAGSFVLFVGVLVVFAALWEDHGEFEAQGGGTFSAFRGDSIGIVKVEGPIFYSDDVVEDLEDYRKNDHVKAVVVRIDSPGGGVAPSQEIYDEIL
ncbi:MAG: signal peptide peptidase SppA, partial [Bdellovibrionota bacterium]